jgi:hypothetical protein
VLVRDVHTLPACTRALINAIKPGLIEAAEASADASPGP